MLREEEIPPTNLGISYKFSRHECPKAFHTWGLDLAGLIYPSLNGCIQVFVALSNSLNGWKQFHSIKAMAMIVANSIEEHIVRRFDILHKIISDNNISHSYQFSKASPIKH